MLPDNAPSAFEAPSSRMRRVVDGDYSPPLAALKHRIARLEGRDKSFEEAPRTAPPWRFGIDRVDACLPHGLASGGLHEISPAVHGDMGAAIGFALSLLETLSVDDTSPRPVFWCQSALSRREFGRPYSLGLTRPGLCAQALIFLTARRESDALWAIEEAVRSQAPAAILGEVREISFLASRRLALAADKAGLPIFLIATKPAGTSAAHTRFEIAARSGSTDPWDAAAPGAAAWHVTLKRARSGAPGEFDLEWCDETRRFRLAAAMADRPDEDRGQKIRENRWATYG